MDKPVDNFVTILLLSCYRFVDYISLASCTVLLMNTDTARWSKSSPSWGSALRVQRNAYAYLVLMVMTGGRHECPACESPLDLATAEVDRAVPALDYREGNVVYLCRDCNQGRAALQSIGRDWTHADDYAAHVADAAAMVTVPSIREAREWWADRPVSVGRVSRYA